MSSIIEIIQKAVEDAKMKFKGFEIKTLKYKDGELVMEMEKLEYKRVEVRKTGEIVEYPF